MLEVFYLKMQCFLQKYEKIITGTKWLDFKQYFGWVQLKLFFAVILIAVLIEDCWLMVQKYGDYKYKASSKNNIYVCFFFTVLL